MSKRCIRWLYQELPGLVAQGVIPAESAEKLRQYYGDADTQIGKRWAIALFAMLGAVLIGGGIILILAHNWTEFGRPLRTVLSFLPLILGQSLVGWVLFNQKTGSGWREGAGAFALLSIGATIALIGQTYHLSDDFGLFMLTWMLVALPLVYLLDAALPAILYLIGISTMAGHYRYLDSPTLAFWPLAALLAPYIWRTVRSNRYHVRSVYLLWFAAIALAINTGICLERSLPGLWIVIYACLFAVFYLTGSFWFNEGNTFWQRPLLTLGGAGIAVLAYILTFGGVWHEIGWHYWRYYDDTRGWVVAIQDYVLAGGLLLVAICLLVTSLRRRKPFSLILGIFPLLVVLVWVSVSLLDAVMPVPIRTIMNLYVLLIGLSTLVTGIKALKLGTVNLGMLVLAALIIARFFDSHVNILFKGIIFILLGLGFLAANLLIVRRKGGVQ